MTSHSWGIGPFGDLAALASTNITSTYDLAKRDPCGCGPQPILYPKYGTDSCPIDNVRATLSAILLN
jgi:hypothetical protein